MGLQKTGAAVVAASRKEIGTNRITLYAITSLTIQWVVIAVWGGRYYLFNQTDAPMLGWDFVVFWSAARVALEHGAALVFSPELMAAMETSIPGVKGLAAWPYPPTFLLAILPAGLLSFTGAFAVFSAAGLTVYALALKGAAQGLDRLHFLFAAGFTGVGVALAAGQNTLFTAAAAAGALGFLASSPILAGACVATLAIKPQLAVLFPLMLASGRQWKALAASAIWALAFAATATAAFGTEAWTAFAAYLPTFNQIFVEHGDSHWMAMPTVFAAARQSRLSVASAYVAQALIAVPAVISTAYLWLREARFELRASALIVCTLLVQPYLMYYDLAWLALSITFLMRDMKVAELKRIEWVVLVAAWLLPIQAFLSVVFDFPCQLAPIVMIALLAVVVRRQFAIRQRPC
ncbi:hypothetical protein C9I57_14220 [Trinickia symbiotica]|uniref:DUF2029 domain-containing protein n=1 Tax=Trinickia symbiotica TaxID=863227 RepID=A0A2T3XUM9_9BURK|nr:glycosyltransferase family 87 protein [Trinickia symbiotica]PTB20229.1 hypothetical protein C9I57_14220 [Trinickia symbiotica]